MQVPNSPGWTQERWLRPIFTQLVQHHFPFLFWSQLRFTSQSSFPVRPFFADPKQEVTPTPFKGILLFTIAMSWQENSDHTDTTYFASLSLHPLRPKFAAFIQCHLVPPYHRQVLSKVLEVHWDAHTAKLIWCLLYHTKKWSFFNQSGAKQVLEEDPNVVNVVSQVNLFYIYLLN